MKIGWMFGLPEKEPVGVNNFIKELGTEVLKYDKKNKYYALETNYLHFDINEAAAIRFSDMAFLHKTSGMLAELKECNIVHSFFNPFEEMDCRSTKIFTIYDLIPLIHPEWHPAFDYFDGPIRRSAIRADKIIVDSYSTKHDVVNCYGVSDDKIHVVYPGHSSKLNFNLANKDCISKYNIDDGYILSVCTLEPRKNIRGLVEAFVEFKSIHSNSKIKLVLTGKAGWDKEFKTYISGLGPVKQDIVLTGFVSNEILASLYKHALVFAYVSYYEGFGLPVLEAMAAGKAVIASNTSSIPEVGGEAAIYCNPYDKESIINAIECAVLSDKERVACEQKSIVQAQKFSYVKAAEDMISIYNLLT